MKTSIIARFGLSVFLVLVAATTFAQDYPSRPIRIVTPFGPGGGADLLARLMSKRFFEVFGQTAPVDNRPGAGGNIGVELVAKSAPDGYTLLMHTGSFSVAVAVYPKLPFDARRDLLPISLVASTPLIVAVNPSLRASSLKELVEIAKKRQVGLNFASSGPGTQTHLALLVFNQVTGMSLTHIPYKGAGPVMTALISAEADVGFPAIVSAQPHLRSGKLRALAVTTKAKSTLMPELPTVDASFPGFDFDTWFGMFAPAGTPPPIVNRIYTAIRNGLQHPETQAFLRNDGAEILGSSPTEFAAFFNQDIEKYSRVAKASGAKPEE